MAPFNFLRNLAVFSAVVTLLPSVANAQEWLKNRRFSEGEGIRAGQFELHPGVGAELGYDSNWFSRTSGTGALNGAPTSPVIGATVLRLTPSITLSTLSGPRAADAPPEQPAYRMQATLAATYRELFGDDPLSKQRNLSGIADVRLEISPNRPFGLNVAAGYTRFIRATAFGDPDNSFNLSQPFGNVEGIYQPGGGTFDFRLGYTLTAVLFEDPVAVGYTNLRHDFSVRSRWRFRPRTSLFQETVLGFVNYTDSSRALTRVSNSVPLRSRIGINGLLSDRLAGLAAVGYGASFIENPVATTQQYDSITGQAELRWYFGRADSESFESAERGNSDSVVALGYLRDFQVSYLGDQVGIDKGYMSVSYFWGNRVLTSLTGSLSYLNYPTVAFTAAGSQPTPAFVAVRPEVIAFAEYRVSNGVGFTANLSYLQNSTQAQLRYAFGTYDLNWSRWQAFGGARVFW